MSELEQRIREAFCDVGRRVWQKDYVASNDGNFSFRLDERRVISTPTMISKGFMKPEDMVVQDLDGNQLSGHRKGTSEIKLHLFIYRERPDIHSVVHVHPPHATAFAIAHQDLPKCVLPEVEVLLGEIPLAPYKTTGTWEFAHSIAPWVRTHDAMLLTNHGAVTMGQDPFDAYYKMETLDQYCRILLLARQLGDWNRIDLKGMHDLLRLKERLGLRDPRTAAQLCADGPTSPPPQLPLPAEPYKPHRGTIEDSPKVPAMGTVAKSPDKQEIEAVIAEVLRRLTTGS